MSTKPGRHLSQKIDSLVMVDGRPMTVQAAVREINSLNGGRPIGDVSEVALASMVWVLKELRRRHGQ